MRSRFALYLQSVALVFCVMFSCGYAGDSNKTGVALPGNPIVAARTFESKKCIHCHLVDFRHEDIGPDLRRITVSSNMCDLVGRMWNSAPEMISKMELTKTDYPELTPEELANLLAYLGVYQNYVVHYSQKADAGNGKRLFQKKKCNSCHTFDSKANTAAPSLLKFRDSNSPLVVLRAMWLHNSYLRKAGMNVGLKWPKFSKSEINDLLAYIVIGKEKAETHQRFLQPGSPQTGKKLFTSLGCKKCHAVKGKGAKKAPNLGNILSVKNMDVYVILETLWNHSPIMWKTLKEKGKLSPKVSTADIADIIAYLLFVNFDRSKGTIHKGQQLFAGKLCANCHEPNMESSGTMDLLSRFWNNLPEMLSETRQEGLEWPTFTDGEMASLVEYLNSVKDE